MPQRTIDGFEFAETGAVLSGGWPVADLPRLQDVLRSNAGSVDYVVRGTHDALGRAALEVSVAGALEMTCQRCLEALALRVDARTTLVLAHSEAEIDGGAMAAEAPERVLAGKEMRVRDLVEDEVLLAVPVAPRHEQCGEMRGAGPAKRPSPFAGLRDLLKHTD